jgi:hypothetical protein
MGETMDELNEEQWNFLQKEMKRKPSKRDVERIKKAKETAKHHILG